MGKIEEWNRMDFIGFRPQDLKMTAGGDMFSAGRLFFCFSEISNPFGKMVALETNLKTLPIVKAEK